MRKDSRTLDQKIADRKAKVDALHEKLTVAVAELITPEDWRRALEFAAKFRRYSFGNTMLIWVQNAQAHEAGLVPAGPPEYVAGYKQWKKLGRHVIKDMAGFQILAPVEGRVAVSEDGSYRRLARGETPEPHETIDTRVVGWAPAYVWPLALTDGDPVPTKPVAPSPQLLQGQAPAGLFDGVKKVIEAKGFTVGDAPATGWPSSRNGLTDYDTKSVQLRADRDDVQRCKTLIHEAGHILLHDRTDQDAAQHRGIKEVEAESVALMVAAAHGMQTDDYSIPYVTTWASRVEGQDPSALVAQTAVRVRRAALEILGALDTVLVPDSDPPGLDQSAKPERAARSGTRRRAAALSTGVTEATALPGGDSVGSELGVPDRARPVSTTGIGR
ncbi:protein of unknown function (DUF955) [Promicromonospora umidemergens]|uniref:Antirestriction protein ArdC n=2 Tax=Promicromonospora TaxID=43676 RepID=A0ABP8XGQ2_9MICO|nr:ArdC-like ssDNA-binding domain-containing protein [Promicromonospora umidemergens]MCP2284925.1 protein of unknown function (DUF955) [Promicromonospora umidemergens]